LQEIFLGRLSNVCHPRDSAKPRVRTPGLNRGTNETLGIQEDPWIAGRRPQ
jgi:hypothetical protein